MGSLSSPSTTIALVVEGDDIEPELFDGGIRIVEESPFQRGDCNSDGVTFPLTDAIFLFRWAFAGGESPACDDAADVDDNDEIEPLLDGLALLRWAFNNGDEPADPGPEECGDDPTEDDLNCMRGGECSDGGEDEDRGER